LADCCDPVLVVSDRADAAGLATARSAGVETRVVPSKGVNRETFDRELLRVLEPMSPDFIVLAGFMRILGPGVVGRFRGRIVNIHPADTKLFKGIGGYEWAWRTGLEVTKITVHLVDEGVDTGPVLAQSDLPLTGVSSLEELERRGLAVEHSLYSRALRDLFTNGLARPPAIVEGTTQTVNRAPLTDTYC
jgi:phosphoribosylglycinamide formyltransferase-1